MIRVQDYDELLEVSQLLANSRKPKKPGVAVVSHSGGISSLTADMLGQSGLPLPPLSNHARDGINAILKDFGWAANPADVTGFARRDEVAQIMRYMIDEPEVGTLVVASAGAGTQVQHVLDLRDSTDKNIAFFFTASRLDKALEQLKAAHLPIFYSPEKLARGLRSLADYHAWRDERLTTGFADPTPLTEHQKTALARIRSHTRPELSEKESKQIIAEWGVPVAREIATTSASGAVEAAQVLGYPVALKIDSPDIAHKTEAGVVRIGLANEQALRAAYDEIMANAANNAPGATVTGVLVQEMVTGGVEMIVGIKYDPLLGPMLVFGSGGVMVEVYNDVALRHCPITHSEALAMISEVKGAKLLRGFRGKPPADMNALTETLVSVSQMAVHLEGVLAEADINPLMVLPAGQGVKAVDALLVLKANRA